MRMDHRKSPVPLMLFKNKAFHETDHVIPKKLLNQNNKIQPEQSQDELDIGHRFESGIHKEIKLENFEDSSVNDIDSDDSSFGFQNRVSFPPSHQFSKKECRKAQASDRSCDSDVDIETIPDSSYYSTLQFSSSAHQQLASSSILHNYRRSSRGGKGCKRTWSASNIHQHLPSSLTPSTNQHDNIQDAADMDTTYDDQYAHLLGSFRFHNYAKSTSFISQLPENLDGETLNRRIHHNTLERVRRQKLSGLLMDLCYQVPAVSCNPKASQIMILNEAASYIRQLESFLQIQDNIIEKETFTNGSLREKLQFLQLQSYPVVSLRKL